MAKPKCGCSAAFIHARMHSRRTQGMIAGIVSVSTRTLWLVPPLRRPTHPVYAEYQCLAAIQSPRTHPIYGEEHRLLKYPCTHPIYGYVESNCTTSIEQRSSTLGSLMAKCALSMPILARLILPFFSWTLAPRPILPIFVATSST